MFLNNKYTKWYYSIVENAKNRNLLGYVEKHHIIPKCLGGSDYLDNLVKLTAREHFIVHKLLVKMTVGRNKSKMSFAYCLFFRKNPNHPERLSLIFNSREYERKKRLLAEATSKLHKGKTVSKETVQKTQNARKRNNKPYPESARKLHSKLSKERWANNYTKMLISHQSKSKRDKISKANKGKIRTDKIRKQISDRTKGNKNPMSRHIKITSPDGEIYYCYGNFQLFCKEHKLPFSSMCHILYKGRKFTKGATVGWLVEYDNLH